MMDLETIRKLSRQAGRTARAHGKKPWFPPGPTVDIDDIRHIPNLGTYRPAGYRKTQELFVDKTGWGGEDEPAMTVSSFLKFVNDNLPNAYGYAITEEGPFQIYIGVFEKK